MGNCLILNVLYDEEHCHRFYNNGERCILICKNKSCSEHLCSNYRCEKNKYIGYWKCKTVMRCKTNCFCHLKRCCHAKTIKRITRSESSDPLLYNHCYAKTTNHHPGHDSHDSDSFDWDDDSLSD